MALGSDWKRLQAPHAKGTRRKPFTTTKRLNRKKQYRARTHGVASGVWKNRTAANLLPATGKPFLSTISFCRIWLRRMFMVCARTAGSSRSTCTSQSKSPSLAETLQSLGNLPSHRQTWTFSSFTPVSLNEGKNVDIRKWWDVRV